MKKWYDEEYEFTVEVTGFLRGAIAETARRSAISTAAPTAARSIRTGRASVLKP